MFPVYQVLDVPSILSMSPIASAHHSPWKPIQICYIPSLIHRLQKYNSVFYIALPQLEFDIALDTKGL